MSLSGTTNTYLPPTLDGLNIIDADAIYINGIPIDTENLVPYTNATKNVNLGTFNFQTLGSISAKEHIFPSFGSTMMTGPTTSSIFYADTWLMNNTIQISSLGGGSFVSTSYLHIADATNQSTLLTLQSDGIADFANTKLRVSTMATSAYDVVNLSTLTSAVAFIENVNALNYVPYTGATNDLNMGGSTITTSGLMNAGALRITSSISNMDYSLSVNSFDQLEIRNMTTGNALVTGGDALAILNINAGGTITTGNIEVSGNSQLIGSGTVVWTQTALSDDYEIKDDIGDTRLKLSKTTGLTISTLNVTAVPSATPTLALGVDGSGGVVSFAVPSGGGLLGSNNTWTGVNQFNNTVSTMGTNRFIQPYNALVTDVSTLVNRATLNASIAGFGTGTVNTSTLPARILPYLSTGTTLTNSLLNQIDNDSMGFGYTTIPSYPLGSGGKNMYINGSIFAGGLNSMVGTFGRNTTTGNQNEITFTASGVGTLLAQIKSHSGPSALVDATWTYSNTNPAPLGANQGQVLLQANNLQVSLGTEFTAITPQFTFNNTFTTFSNATSFLLRNNAVNPSIFNIVQKSAGPGSYHSLTQGGDTLLLSMDQQNGVSGGNGILIAGWNQTAGLRIGPSSSAFSGDVNFSGAVRLNGNGVPVEWINGTNGYIRMFTFNGLNYIQSGLTAVSNSSADLVFTSMFAGAEWFRIGANGKFTATNAIASINGGNSYAVPSGFMSAGSLTIGDQTKNYGGGVSGWTSNTAGLMFECAVNTEIAVHDGGDRVASFMYYSGNTFTIGRDMGWGGANISMPGIVSITGALTLGYSRYLYPPELAGATYGSLAVKGTGRNGWAGYTIYNDNNEQVSFMMNNTSQIYGLYNATTTRWNFLLDGAGDVIILNTDNSRGFRTHNALTSNVIYNATPTTASNIGTWNGFGYTLLSNTQTPAGNAPCLGFGCNYSNTGQITCLQPGISWMNLAIFNAQTTFTYFGVACGYTVPSGGANVSDVREKHCISDVCTKNSLRKVMCLKPKYYKRKYYDEGTDEQGNPKTKVPDDVKNAMCIGVMAQDLLDSPLAPTVTVAPTKSDGACGDDDGTRYGVNYGDINIHLIGAVQELKKQNDRQQKEIEDLRAYKSLSEERFEKMGRLIEQLLQK
jgi:hypothetical protein